MEEKKIDKLANLAMEKMMKNPVFKLQLTEAEIKKTCFKSGFYMGS